MRSRRFTLSASVALASTITSSTTAFIHTSTAPSTSPLSHGRMQISGSNWGLNSVERETIDSISNSPTPFDENMMSTYILDESFHLTNAKEQAATSIGFAEESLGMPWSESISPDSPLLYMPFWEWQMNYMKENLSNLRLEECTTPSYGDVSYNENTSKKARIVNMCFSSDEYRKIRMTYYDAGDTCQVFNSLWYPDPSYNLPVLGIDLLAFNRKKYLGIVDFQPLHEKEEMHASTFESILAPIKEQYPTLKGKMSSKFYDETQFFSNEMLFARFDNKAVVFDELYPAFQEYVASHVDLIHQSSPSQDNLEYAKVLDRQGAYDTYSAERDPATGLFAAMFGKEWADEFVYDFLFNLSESPKKKSKKAADEEKSSQKNRVAGSAKQVMERRALQKQSIA